MGADVAKCCVEPHDSGQKHEEVFQRYNLNPVPDIGFALRLTNGNFSIDFKDSVLLDFSSFRSFFGLISRSSLADPLETPNVQTVGRCSESGTEGAISGNGKSCTVVAGWSVHHVLKL